MLVIVGQGSVPFYSSRIPPGLPSVFIVVSSFTVFVNGGVIFWCILVLNTGLKGV